jgi:hypothetical protein
LPKDIAMNLRSDWPRIKNDIRNRWPSLSDADVARVDGDSDTLCSVIEERYQISHEDADRQVQDFLDKRGSGNVWESPSRVPSGSQTAGGNPGQGAPARSGSSSGRGPEPMSPDERRRKEEERKRQSRGTEEKTETPEESGE